MDKMTEQMAIETHIGECKNRIDRIKEFMESNSDANTSECCLNIRVLEKSIQVLEEIQQYRAIGTVEEIKFLVENVGSIKLLKEYSAIGTIEELQALKEKSVAKKPNYEGDGYYNGELVLDTWICPNCEKSYEVDYEDYEYCPNCGQHIDHSSLTEDD